MLCSVYHIYCRTECNSFRIKSCIHPKFFWSIFEAHYTKKKKGIMKLEMTVWTHNKWTLFRRAHIKWALLRQVLLVDGYDLLFSRSNSLLRSPGHLHVPGYPAFWSCSVFSVSIHVLVLSMPMYSACLSIPLPLLRPCSLLSICQTT